MDKGKIAFIFIILMFLIYPVFGMTLGNVVPYQKPKYLTGPGDTGPLSPHTVIEDDHKIGGFSYLLYLLYPEPRPEGYDESCTRSLLIEHKMLIPGDQLGLQGQYNGDIVNVYVRFNPEIRYHGRRVFL